MPHKIEDVRNIAVCGHSSSGKTSLVDAMLVLSGAVNSKPNVDDGTSICDFDEEEKHHKHSIEATITHFEHAGKQFNVIDTPGYPDLIGQTISSLHGVDTALIVIDAHAGIKVNTIRAWEEATKAGIGHILCITKLDDRNIDFQGLLDSIHETFGKGCVLFDSPDALGTDFHGVIDALDPVHGQSSVVDLAAVHEETVEAIVEVDDEAMERYFEGEEPDHAKLAELAKLGEKQGRVTPIDCVSVKNEVGVKELLDMLAEEAFNPTDVTRTGTVNGDQVTITPDANGPLAAQVFRTRIDPFVQKLSFIRVHSGTLKRDSTVSSPGLSKGIKIGALLKVQADKTEPVDSAGPGDIVAVAKCDELHTGMSLGEVELPPIKFPKSMISMAVSAKNHGDEAKLASALHKLVEEDPTVRVQQDNETHETVLTGMSELHLNLVRERLARRDHVEIATHEPKIPYHETILAEAEGSYRHKKQSGGAGQFAEVHIRVFPFPEGTDPKEYATKSRFPQLKNVHYHPEHNFLWVDTVVGGSIPGNFMPAIDKGFVERLNQGVIAGCHVQNLCVEVHFGKDHPVDSNENAFKTAASRVLAEVFKKAKPVLLEPCAKMEVTVPEDKVGDISSDLSTRRGQMLGMDQAPGGMSVISAKAPLSEVMTYARTLGSITGGQGTYTLDFDSYEPVPGNIQQTVMAEASMVHEEA